MGQLIPLRLRDRPRHPHERVYARCLAHAEQLEALVEGLPLDASLAAWVSAERVLARAVEALEHIERLAEAEARRCQP